MRHSGINTHWHPYLLLNYELYDALSVSTYVKLGNFARTKMSQSQSGLVIRPGKPNGEKLIRLGRIKQSRIPPVG